MTNSLPQSLDVSFKCGQYIPLKENRKATDIPAKDPEHMLSWHPHNFLREICVSLGPSACADCHESVFSRFLGDSLMCGIMFVHRFSTEIFSIFHYPQPP